VACEVPLSAVLPACFYAVALPLLGFHAAQWPALFLVSLLNIQVAAALSMALSVGLFDHQRANAVAIVLMVFIMSAGGFVVDMAALPPPLAWLRFASYWHYSLSLFFHVAIRPFGPDGAPPRRRRRRRRRWVRAADMQLVQRRAWRSMCGRRAPRACARSPGPLGCAC